MCVSRIEVCRLLAVALLAGSVSLSGCGFGSSGPSNYEKMVNAQENAQATLIERGGNVAKKQYPPGEAYQVDLSGMQIDDELLTALTAVPKIAELNFSGSTITDEQFASIATRDKLGYLYVLNVSDTAISDKGLMEASELGVLANINAKGSKITPAGVNKFRKAQPQLPFGLKLKVEL